MAKQTYTVRPSELAAIQFDFRDWVAARVAEGQTAGTLVFEMRFSAGLTVNSTSPEIGLIDVTATSTRIGGVFEIGIEGRAPDGDSIVDVRKVRVRDPSVFEQLPEDESAVDFVVDPLGNFLVDPLGNFIVSP
jgi:hypothetical protein